MFKDSFIFEVGISQTVFCGTLEFHAMLQ